MLLPETTKSQRVHQPYIMLFMDFSDGPVVKNPPSMPNTGDSGSISALQLRPSAQPQFKINNAFKA